tara:strand:- start:98 stop:508 length:411 start_codon:yes stop_codon:yes gene_type:complete
MKKELLGPKVENVAIAIAQSLNVEGEKVYYVYLLNLRDDIMEGIIVCSKGYGEDPSSGEKIKTSTLRHTIEVLLPNEAAKIEPIMEEVFSLYNEYWVSFWVDGILYDKKYVFHPEQIYESNFKHIDALNKKGILLS